MIMSFTQYETSKALRILAPFIHSSSYSVAKIHLIIINFIDIKSLINIFYINGKYVQTYAICMGSVLKFFCRIRVKVIYFITYIQLNILRKYQAVLSHPLILKSKFVQHQIYFTNPMSDVLFIYYYIHNNIMIILMVSIFAVQFISKNGNIE